MSNFLREAKEVFKGGYYEKLLLIESEELDPDEAQRLTILNELISRIETLIKTKGRGITTNQLRNVYAEVKRIPDHETRKFVLLRPKLAYISARQQNKEARIITDFIGALIQEAETPEQFKSLKIVMEAMVAYHKLYHPKSQ